jgi:hypothetical protein
MKTTAIILAVTAMVACGDSNPLAVEESRGNSNAPIFGVATWNVYVGAPLSNLLQIQDPNQIPFEVAGLMAHVEANNFGERAQAIAAELAASQPAVVSLQEVSTFRRQSPGDFLVGNPVAAETVVMDYLQILMDALSDHGTSYTVAATATNLDIELPTVDFSTGGLDDIRLTDYDVILVRSDVHFANAASGNFQAVLPIALGGVTIPKPSGWASVDVAVRGDSYRIFNAHLEPADVAPGVLDPQLAGLQAAQAAELRGIMDASPMPVILTGDLNTAADGSTTSTYDDLIAAGFADTWLEGPSRGLGYTSNQAPDLLNSQSQLFHRIDFVLYRSAATARTGKMPGSVRAELMGEEQADRTPSGLWPSDHAGLSVVLTLPPGQVR